MENWNLLLFAMIVDKALLVSPRTRRASGDSLTKILSVFSIILAIVEDKSVFALSRK